MVHPRSADRPGGRPGWLPLAAAALVVPTVLAGLTLLWPRPQIEAGLTRAASESLAAAGISAATVSFSGRDATVTGVTGPDAQRAVEIVEGIGGVRVARIADPAAPIPATPLRVTRRGADVVLVGTVGTEQERTALVDAAAARAGGRTVVDELTVTAGADPGADAATVGAAAAVLDAAADGVTACIDGDTVALIGTVADEDASAAVEEALAAAAPERSIDNRLAVTDAGSGPAADRLDAAAGELDAAARQRLDAAISAVIGGAPITFEPNSPALTAQGAATVARVVALVTAAPGARLRVDGFVATGPGDGRLTAQQLSDARAATVRDALAAGGVPADRLTVRGLGEGQNPAADIAGRRVDIAVV